MSESPAALPNARRRVGVNTTCVLVALCLLIGGLVAAPSLTRTDRDGLDAASHVMMGLFFADFIRDLPLSGPYEYVLQYYAQYPALGFVFWPPAFHLFEGIVFVLMGGSPLAPRVAMLLASASLGALYFLATRRALGSGFAVLATMLLMTQPTIATSSNRVMLEVPALTMCMLVVVLYQRVAARGDWSSWREPVVLAAAAAAALYTKQTAAFVLVAIALHILISQRVLRKPRRLWLPLLAFLVMAAPLVWFTLAFGQANLVQAFGELSDLREGAEDYPAGFEAARASLASWLYYPRSLAAGMNPGLWLAAAVAIVATLVRRQFREGSLLWVLYLVSFWLQFSLFDNKQLRFASFAVPAVIFLAVALLRHVAGEGRGRQLAVAVALSVVLLMQVAKLPDARRPGYDGMQTLLSSLLASGDKGNIAYFGGARQLFAAPLRHVDSARERYLLQGDDVLAAVGTLDRVSYHYRVRWLLIEQEYLPSLHGALKGPSYREVGTASFGPPHRQFSLRIFVHDGELAPEMMTVPLYSETLGLSARPPPSDS